MKEKKKKRKGNSWSCLLYHVMFIADLVYVYVAVYSYGVKQTLRDIPLLSFDTVFVLVMYIF